jgi:predicted component of type VI protein secretion system
MASQTFQLVLRAGPSPGKTFSLSKSEVVIGRDVSADIVINAAEISRRHSRLRLEAGGYIIEDLGSTNGTFVNGQRLTGPHLLRPGEVVMLGEAVSLAYEVAQHDSNATMVSPSGGRAAAPPPQPMAAPPQPMSAPPPRPAPPAYAGQVPAGPAVAEFEEPVGKKGISWIWAGVGCLVVVLCLVVVGVLLFDMFDFYCTPPFDSLFSFLYSCP